MEAESSVKKQLPIFEKEKVIGDMCSRKVRSVKCKKLEIQQTYI
jgi:hypothetical protein